MAPTIVIHTDLDCYTAPILRDVIWGLLDHQPARLVIDFAQVRHMTSYAVAALLDMDRRARSVDCTLTLINVAPKPYRALYQAGVICLLNIHPTPAV